MKARRWAVALALAAASMRLCAFPATAQTKAPATAQPLEAPATVLAKYEEALDRVLPPKIVRFEYAVEQVGPHNISQTHRVYRSGLNVRDETLSADGQSLQNPSIHIAHDKVNRYTVTSLAPRARDYTFSYIGHHRDGLRVDYVFSSIPRVAGANYVAHAVTVDGLHFLPRAISFTTMAVDGVRGHGTLAFFPQNAYWVIQEATVTAQIAGKVARERLVFHNYDFPPSLPTSTFVEPRPAPTATP